MPLLRRVILLIVLPLVAAIIPAGAAAQRPGTPVRAAPPPAVPAPAAPTPVESPVNPGDSVGVVFYGRPELSGVQSVDLNGDVQLPYLGRVRVRGLASEQIRDLLTRRYAAANYPNAQIFVRTRIGVNLIGEVGDPGHYWVDPTTTVLDLISGAGGPTIEAREDRVELRRGGRVTLYNLNTDQERLVSTPLQSGDLVVIPRRPIGTNRVQVAFGVLQFLATLVSTIIYVTRS